MHVLMATREGQGKRSNDFSFTKPDELVGFTSECDGERVDGRCGCRRAFSGLDSHYATTTAIVLDVDYTPESYRLAVGEALVSQGWITSTDDPLVKDSADELARLAAAFPVGTVVEKRGNTVQERRL